MESETNDVSSSMRFLRREGSGTAPQGASLAYSIPTSPHAAGVSTVVGCYLVNSIVIGSVATSSRRVDNTVVDCIVIHCRGIDSIGVGVSYSAIGFIAVDCSARDCHDIYCIQIEIEVSVNHVAAGVNSNPVECISDQVVDDFDRHFQTSPERSDLF
jgi:hypothetical protein